MKRKSAACRVTIEALEGRSLMATGLAGILSQQARLEALLAATRGACVHASEVGASRVSAAAAPTQQQIQKQLKRLHQQELRAQGKILSAVSLNNTTIQVQLKQKLNRPI